MARFRKSDVETRWEHGRELPCVNVKVRRSVSASDLERAEKDSGETGFAAWAQALLDSNSWPDWTWEAALEHGWEMLQADAEELFGRVKVYSAGRSGGWCIVEGLPDLASWDALMVAKWGKFARWARAYADGIPYDMASLLAINTYSAERARKAAQDATRAAAESQVS